MASVTGLLADLHGDCFRLLCTATGVDAPGLAVVARIAKRAGKITAATCRRLEKVDNAFAVARHLSSPKTASFQAALAAELRGEGGSVPGDLLGKDLQPTDQVQTAAQPGEHNSDMGKQDLVEDEATNGQDEAVASPEAGGPVVRSQALPMEQLAARSVIAFGGLAAGDLFSQATGLTMTSSTPSAPPRVVQHQACGEANGEQGGEVDPAQVTLSPDVPGLSPDVRAARLALAQICSARSQWKAPEPWQDGRTWASTSWSSSAWCWS